MFETSYSLSHQACPLGIQEAHWLNLYDSFLSNRIDVVGDGQHPGIKSNQFYFQQLSCTLEKNKIYAEI